tara:strand:+ start:1238 stop:1444 length:207 start_codon:yes stop_codon:yes gene_type:complete
LIALYFILNIFVAYMIFYINLTYGIAFTLAKLERRLVAQHFHMLQSSVIGFISKFIWFDYVLALGVTS